MKLKFKHFIPIVGLFFCKLEWFGGTKADEIRVGWLLVYHMYVSMIGTALALFIYFNR